MPLYEYQCKQCGHRFEKIQSFSAPEEKVCPACGGEVERLISAPAFQFKGSGFYITDYAAKGGAKPSAASSESSGSGSSSEGKTASSSETKPAASPAPAPSSTTKSE